MQAATLILACCVVLAMPSGCGAAMVQPSLRSEGIALISQRLDDIINPIPDPTCKKGVASPDLKVCCTDECGSCGQHKLCDDVGKYNEATGKLADNCCRERIAKKAVSCNENHPPCVLDDSYAKNLSMYKFTRPKRHAMDDCNKAPEMARFKHTLGIQKGEFYAQLYLNGKTKYEDALDIAIKVARLVDQKLETLKTEDGVLKSQIEAATDEDKVVDKLTGVSKFQKWQDDLESHEAEITFYGMIEKNAKEVDGRSRKGIKNVADLKEKVDPEKDVEPYQLKLNALIDDATLTYKDAELLWQQWMDSSKDYSCGAPPAVSHAASVCKDGNTKYQRKCHVTCQVGYDDEVSKNAFRCTKQGKFGKQLYGEWQGIATCVGKNCGLPPKIGHGKTVIQEIRFPNVAQYNCNEGYSVDGHADSAKAFPVPCGTDGNYKQNVSHQCQKIKCGPAPPKKHTAAQPDVVHYYNDRVSFKCKTGYTLDETPGGLTGFSVTCQATGKFTDSQSCKAVRCGPAPDFTNTKEPKKKDDRYFGDEVNFACRPGYSLDQNPAGEKKFTLICSANGEFLVKGGGKAAALMPKCQPVTAGMSPLIAHGNLAPVELFYGDHKLVTGDEGYTVPGKAFKGTNFEVSVSTDGKLVGLETFKPVSCGAPPAVKHSASKFSKKEAVFGDVLAYDCDAGYSTDLTPLDSAASFSVTCESDGDFSKIPGTGGCGNINDCASHTCGPHGECVDLLMDYKCDCDRGFEQTVDEDSKEKVCGNINDCGPEACGVGKCIDLIEDFKCECPKGFEQTGDGKEKTCTAKICGIPPEADHAATSPVEAASAKASYQDKVVYQCDVGHTLDGKAGGKNHFDITCKADTSFTSKKECKPIQCPDVPKVTKGKASASKAVFNETIKYKCEPGYTVDGTNEGDAHFSIQCLVTGTYSDVQECKPVTCGQPDDIANSFRESGQVYFPQKRKYDCFEGFTLNGEAGTKADFEVECQKDGKLTKTKQCLPVVCGDPKKFVNVMFATTADMGPVAYPQTAEVTCRDGYTVGGDPKGESVFGVQCIKTGKFEKYDERNCDPVRCGAPPAFPNATLAKVASDDPAKPGLREKVYYFDQGGSVPDLTKREPAMKRIVATVNIPSTAKPSGFSRGTHYAVQWTGTVSIEKKGKYTFSVTSDDGSKFWLNDVLTVNNDGLHGMKEVRGSADLAAGPHAVRLVMFNNGGPGGAVFKYEGADTDGSMIVVPQKVLQSRGANINFEEKATYECLPGFTAGGEADAPTSFHVECLANGEISYPPADMQCRNVNACEEHTCGARGTCVDVVGKSIDAYECKCEFGFEVQMVKGEKHCGNIDDCGKHECGPGTCKDLIGDYTCICPSGHYIGMLDGEKTCLPVRCALKAPDLKDGKMLTSHKGPVDFPVSLRYRCNTGYSVDGSVAEAKRTFHANCKPDASLYGMMSCQKVTCGTARVLTSTRLISPGPLNSIEYKEKASYQCDEGFALEGKPGGKTTFEVECQDSGVLTDPEVCKPVKCGKAPRHSNSKPGIAGDIFYGMHLEYACDSGYTLTGSLSGGSSFTRNCQKDGNFGSVVEGSGSDGDGDGELFMDGDGDGEMTLDFRQKSSTPCKAIKAGELPDIPNAELAEYNGAKPESSSVVAYYPDGFEYHCKPGHTLNGCATGQTKFTARVNALGQFVPALPAKCIKVGYRASGLVKDARTGRAISGAVVKLEGTDPLISATSYSGYFTLRNIAPGTYTVKYKKDGMIDVERRVTISNSIATGGVMDISMSPKMADDQWRIVVKWNRRPSDLDSYAKWGWSKVCWYKRNQFGGRMTGKLEKDDTNGYGPETVYLSGVGKCTGTSMACDIKYLVNDYTRSGKMFDISGAAVTLYTGARVAGSWNIKDCKPSVTGSGNWWHVFTIDGRTNTLKWECKQPPLPAVIPGLIEDVFYFSQGRSLPILNGRVPNMRRTVAMVNYGRTSGKWHGFTKSNNFAVRWEGSIRIKLSGAYTFYLTSDDGSKVWLDETLVANNDGIHGMREKSGTKTLDAKLHGVRIDMFEKGGASGCIFKYKGQDTSNRKVVVGTSALRTNPVLAGLSEEVFYFDKSLRTLPNLNGLRPNLARPVETVNYPSTSGKWSGLERRDKFAARWTGYVEIRVPGRYTFYITSDDGSKLYVKNSKLIDNNGLHGMKEKSGSKTLTTGTHEIRYEHFENGGGAGATLKYKGPDSNNQKIIMPKTAFKKLAGEPPATDADAGLLEETFYFRQGSSMKSLTGRTASKARVVPYINYRSTSGKWPGFSSANNFAVRWTGSLLISLAGTYTLSIQSDDGSKLWLEQSLLIDNDGLHGMRTKEGTKSLDANGHTLRIEQFEKGGGAGCIFKYKGPQTGHKWTVVPQRALLKKSSTVGLLEEGFFFGQGRSVPNTADRETNWARKVTSIYYPATRFSGWAREDQFAARWTGGLLIELTGSYSFYVTSDDGSKMYFGNKLIINNDGLHGMKEKSATKSIKVESQQHMIRLEMFQRHGGAGMMFLMKGPDTGGSKVVPPTSAVRMMAGMPDVVSEDAGIREDVFYINGMRSVPNLNGRPVKRTRTVGSINYGSTGGAWSGFGGRKDNFAVRWSGSIAVARGGDYTFYLSSDDGSKLWVSGVQMINNDGLHGMRERSSSRRLSTGLEALRVDMFERGGGAGCKFWYKGPDTNNRRVIVPKNAMRRTAAKRGWVEEQFYFKQGRNCPNLEGRNPNKERVVAAINYGGTGNTWPGFSRKDDFANRWTGSLIVTKYGSYRFYLTSDDGSQAWVDSQRIIDNNGLHGMRERSGSRKLDVLTTYQLRVEQFERGGGAGCVFKYEGPGTGGRNVVPGAVMANTVGNSCDWQCYLNRYPDLQKAFGKTNVGQAEAHWYRHGKKEGRICKCDTCDYQCYLNRYPDLQRAFGRTNVGAAERHWNVHGKKENRCCTCSGCATGSRLLQAKGTTVDAPSSSNASRVVEVTAHKVPPAHVSLIQKRQLRVRSA